METTCIKDIRPWLLSKILDDELVGTKEEIDLRRRSLLLSEYIKSVDQYTLCTTGSVGDGFRLLSSDTDAMYILNYVILMQTELNQSIYHQIKNKTVLLINKGDCRPGYVTLKVGHIGEYKDPTLMNSIVQVHNSYFLSSDIFREESMELLRTLGVEGTSTGPSNKVYTPQMSTADYVECFPCSDWPDDAQEWISRSRLHGWPSNVMINEIVNKGCHVVPVGDKCSGDTFLQWRISFAAAERYLVHSLNHTQFKVYGLLKYLLNQIKYRIKQDIGDDDILCSYFMKTLIFYAVENSPHSLWQEKNILVCFWLSFTMLLDWVHSGYCPNYFIKANNMFLRKVQGESRRKLENILSELHQMQWKALSVGTVYRPSLLERIHFVTAKLRDKRLVYLTTPDKMEYRRDCQLHLCVFDFKTIAEPTKGMSMLCKAHSDTDEVFAYFTFVQTLRSLSLKLYEDHKSVSGNKRKYILLKKCKHFLSVSFGSDQLYLATLHYQTGNYNKAIELCWKVSLNNCRISDSKQYTDVYCGRQYSTMHKFRKTHTNPIVMHNCFDFCLPYLHLEKQTIFPHPLLIPQLPYALFVLFLCYHNVGDTNRGDEVLQHLEAVKYDALEGGHENWIVHTLLGICYQTKGDDQKAISAYQDSLLASTRRNPALQRINALNRSSST